MRYSRYIIAWKLCTTMKTEDVTDTLDLALQASGCDQATVLHKPRLLSDNGSSYISGELADWLEDQKMDHVRGTPYHPQDAGGPRAAGGVERRHGGAGGGREPVPIAVPLQLPFHLN